MRHIFKVCLAMLFVTIATSGYASAFSASNADKHDGQTNTSASNVVKYKGKTFTISTLNENEAIKEISNARKVYAFVVSKVAMNTGNSCDFNNTFFNPDTNEYAVEVWVNDENKKYTKNCFVIFSLKGAKIKKTLPDGFEYNSTDVAYVGDNTKAGYCYADYKGRHNSYIVYVK